MAYVKNTWSTGDVITATKLNNIETGIETNDTGLATHAALATHKQVSGVTQSGSFSSAEGSSTTASGGQSHAEGDSTTAKSNYSHAEGQYTLACHGTLYNITAFDNTAKTITLDNVTGLIVGDLLTIKITNVKAIEDIPITAINGLVVTLNTAATITSSWEKAIEKAVTMYPVHAEGNSTTASGNYSHAEGYNTTASGGSSHAEGQDAIANGGYSHAEGYNTTASGAYSHAEGQDAIASGDTSHAEGYFTTANGGYSHAEGANTTASSNYSHAEGYFTTASGTASHAQNTGTYAQGLSQTAIGEYNVLQGTSGSRVTTDAAFIIGNGTSGAARANAFRVTWGGAAYGLSAYNSSGADYSEFFEWLDGNVNSEDRVGYFVTLDGEKIRKANASDDYILGIVSAAPAIVGDSYNNDWQGRYVTDIWGRRQTHEVIVPADIAEDGTVISPEHTDTVFVQNPEWNPETPYIPRDERKEWSTIGMLGKLFVRDDGTCQINSFCKSNDEGIATASTSGYRVIKRVSENIVQVLLK